MPYTACPYRGFESHPVRFVDGPEGSNLTADTTCVPEPYHLVIGQQQKRGTITRAVAQLGSALDWGSRGRRFESGQPDSVLWGVAHLSEPEHPRSD